MKHLSRYKKKNKDRKMRYFVQKLFFAEGKNIKSENKKAGRPHTRTFGVSTDPHENLPPDT
jgi:hypothetical protein